MGGASAGLSTSVLQGGMSLLKGTAIMTGTAAVNSAGTQLIKDGTVNPTQVLVDTAIAGGTFFAGTALAKAISGGGCFVAGIVVATSLGLKNIEGIKNGDYVLAENPETGEQEYKMVVDTYVHKKTTIVELEIAGETIETTVERGISALHSESGLTSRFFACLQMYQVCRFFGVLHGNCRFDIIGK